jgi:hypothetical protein
MHPLNKAWLTRLVAYNGQATFAELDRAHAKRQDARGLLWTALALLALAGLNAAAELIH